MQDNIRIYPKEQVCGLDLSGSVGVLFCAHVKIVVNYSFHKSRGMT